MASSAEEETERLISDLPATTSALSNQRRGVGRRSVLLTSAFALTAFSLGLDVGTISEKRVAEGNLTAVDNETIRNNIERAGLTRQDYDLLCLMSEIQSTFGVMPDFSAISQDYTTTHDSSELYGLLARIGAGLASEQETTIFRDGWADDVEKGYAHAQQNAMERFGGADGIEIDTSITGEDPKLIRDRLNAIGANFPLLLLGVKKVVIIKGGGSFDPNTGTIQLPSLTNELQLGPDNFEVTTFHEGTHAFEASWQNLKQYMDRGRFLDYMYTKLAKTYDFVRAYAKAPYNTASMYVDGHPLVAALPTNISTIDDVIALEQNLGFQEYLDEHSRDARIYLLLPGATSDAWVRYNRIAHFAVKRLVEIAEKPASMRTAADLKLLENQNAQILAAQVFAEILHYYVGPVQKIGGGLPQGNGMESLSNPSSILTMSNIAIQITKCNLLYPFVDWNNVPIGTLRDAILMFIYNGAHAQP